jgi:hypothetical protein
LHFTATLYFLVLLLLFLCPLVYPPGCSQRLARQLELIRWAANSAKLFSMGNFKNRLAAIQTTSLVALLPIEDPGPPPVPRMAPGSGGGRGFARRTLYLACVPCSDSCVPVPFSAYPVPFLAYPAAIVAYPVVIRFGLARSKGSEYGVPCSVSCVPCSCLPILPSAVRGVPCTYLVYPIVLLLYLIFSKGYRIVKV